MSLSDALLVFAVVAPLAGAETPQQSPRVLQSSSEEFNRNDAGRESTYIDNKAAWAWLERNIPLFECAYKALEQIHYFRWWTFRKHIQKTLSL